MSVIGFGYSTSKIEISGSWGDDYTGHLYWRSKSDRVVTSYPWKDWVEILDTNNYSSYAASASHTHSYLPLSGGTLSGSLSINFSSGYGTYYYGPADESSIEFFNNGTRKAVFGSYSDCAFIWNNVRSNTLRYNDNGTLTFEGNTVWHGGNFNPSNYSLSSHNHDGTYVKSYGTTNDSIDSDWGQSFKTFNPIPSGNPPEQNPNISILSIGDNYIRRKQLAFIYNNDNIYYRRRTDGGWNSWVKLVHSGNIGSQSVNYATSAGSANYSTYINRIWQRANNCLADEIPVENETTFYMYDSDTTNKPTSAAGFMIANGWDWGKGGSLIAQNFDDGDGGRLYTNFRLCGGNWNGWKKVAFVDDITWNNVSGKPFNWSGQSGQPTWLWGSNDGTNYYVWNPSNFSVNYATSAGIANSPRGFSFSDRSSNDWTGVPGTFITDWAHSSGADIMFKNNGGALHVITDGYFYQGIDYKGATYRVLDEYDITHTTWGNASTATSSGCSDYVKVFSSSGWNDIKSTTTPLRVYFYDSYNDGGPTTYGNVIDIVGIHGHWEPQLFFGGWTGGHVYFRNKDYNGDSFGSWKTLIDSELIGSQSVNYATSAGSVAWGNITGKPDTFAPSSHSHTNIASLGNKNASDLSSTYPSGLSTSGIYGNGYPFSYGCCMTSMANGGAFQIAGQWNSDVTGASNYDFPTEMYIRGRRDSYDVWTTWTRVVTNRNWSSIISISTLSNSEIDSIIV